jgi:outer membrane protein OmpA-like peptidoglycan-associated protein
MHRELRVVFPLFILLVALMASCTSVRLRNANEYYDAHAYTDAIRKYEKVLEKRMIPEAMIRLADCYRQIGNTHQTEILYSKIIRMPEARPVHYLYLADALMANGKYQQAKGPLIQYLQVSRGDLRAQNMLWACDSIDLFYSDTLMYEISLLPFNQAGVNNFSPAFYRSGIVFVTDGSQSGSNPRLSNVNRQRYFDLFYAKKTEKGHWLEPEPLRGPINGPYNEGPAAFTYDFNTIFFTRNYYQGITLHRNRQNYSNLRIFKGSFIGGEWIITSDLPFNNPEYSTAHPTLTTNGLMLYFASDMPWGYGGMDIYISRFTEGNWSVPRNLGNRINTNGNELFPFIHNDTILFFASDGHPGLGSLDIFQSFLVRDEWTQPENLGYPVNSSKDDFGFIIDPPGTSGYFSSNRADGTDKIYQFRKKPPVITLIHRILNTPLPLSVTLTLETHGSDTTFYFGNSSEYAMTVRPNEKYIFRITAPGYYTTTDTVMTPNPHKSVKLTRTHRLKEIIKGERFRSYAFRFEKGSTVLTRSSLASIDSLAMWLRLNPAVEIEIQVHTDARGNDKDNLTLSQKRALQLAEYLSVKGIHPRRLTALGMGETRLLNHCKNNILCLEEDHEVNNRVEIIVTAGERK